MGINVRRIFTLVFALGSALAAMGGVIAAPYLGVFPAMGSIFQLQAFIAVVIGGMGSSIGAAVGTLVGPILGASIIQLLGYWLERWFGASWTLIYGIIFMLIVIFLPYGIVGTLHARSFRIKDGWKALQKTLAGK